MIDLHSHVLPDTDDGAKSYDMALAMLAIAIEDGITSIAATPHFIPGAFAPTGAEVRQAVLELSARAKAHGLAITITPGHEVRVGTGLLEKLRSGEILALDPKRRYLLLEMPGSGVPVWMDRLLFELEVGDVVPILAHPERNVGVIKTPKLLYDLVEKGCMVQITAGSITGRFGQKAQETALLLLRHDLVHLVASDAHDSADRVPVLSEARAIVGEFLGAARTAALFEHNPEAILRGADFFLPEPKMIEESERHTVLSIFRKFLSGDARARK